MKKKQGVAETVNQNYSARQQVTVPASNCYLFPDRIKVLLDEVNGNAAEMARRLDLKDTTVRKWRDGITEPGRETLANIADVFGVSAEWLLHGRGEMRPDPTPSPDTFNEEFAQVPIYNVSVSAGHGAVVGHEEPIGHLAFTRYWLRKKGLQESGLVGINAMGDSMEPTISDGDMLLIDTHQVGVGSDGVFVVRLGEWLMVKRVQRLPGDQVRVLSDNRRYDPIDMPAPDLEVTGRVVWVGHAL